MKRTRGRVVHIESLAEFDRRIAAGATSMSGWRVRSVDLTDRTAELERSRVAGASFVGCTFEPEADARMAAGGALVLPIPPTVPVDVARAGLYTAAELYDDASYPRSLDGRAYAWSQRPFDAESALSQALHDHAIDVALTAWAGTRHIVGVMGGHAVQRGEEGYADAARLGHALGRSHVLATGGGPGAMEAGNLGARFAWRPVEDLEVALDLLARVPSYRPSVEEWLRAALDVVGQFPEGSESLGIPTWHYGHEPANVFATAIAKYFRNATREAILVEVCDAGIIFLPGLAGTVQEMFQDACENYYVDESSVAPMVLVGVSYWTDVLPAWPLLRSLARGRHMESHMYLVDTVEEAAALMAG